MSPNLTGTLVRGGNLFKETSWTHTLRQMTMWRSSKREASGETNPASILILDFQPPDYEKVNFCCLCYPVSGILLWWCEQIQHVNICWLNEYLRKAWNGCILLFLLPVLRWVSTGYLSLLEGSVSPRESWPVRKVSPHLYQHMDGPHWSFSGADGTKVLLMMLYPMACSVVSRIGHLLWWPSDHS